jgi:1,4-alpha-glucan branching enzyme
MERLDYIEQLGVNAIELMPICEFDGNYNWGYSPNHYFAPDRAYGSENQIKTFIDECHKRGIAVIMDMVFNHATGLNPMNKLYPHGNEFSKNPWFCTQVPHDDNVYEKWNHDFDPAKDMFTRALKYWIREYRVDGYRMDLSHGLCGCGTKESYDFEKLMNNLFHYYEHGVLEDERVANNQYPNGEPYFILEHWGPNQNTQRPRLVDRGMLCWENTNNAYMQTTMGWLQDGDDLSRANKDGYVSYCESHDEERMQYKAKRWGAGSIATDSATRLNRIPENVLLNVLLDGPHMIWQFEEIGYDFSINSDIDHTAVGQEDNKYRCNTKPRPEALGYFADPNRVNAYAKCAQAIQLRTKLHPEWFAGNPTAAQLGAGMKVRYVQWGSNVIAVANFDASTAQSYTVPSGAWYDYFAGGSVSGSISLQPGEVKILTGSPVTAPTINTDLESMLPIENVWSNESSSAYKILRDGQIYILRGEKVYTMQGQLVR